MTNEITQRPEQRQREMGPMEQMQTPQSQAQQTRQRAAGAFPCPHCGSPNEPEAKYCAVCGELLHADVCPNCGADIDPEADYCEVCHHYIRNNVCSFCGAKFNETDPYCPECGSPRGGIVCPNCRTLNDFAFCKQCGQPLTDNARQVVSQLKQQPEYLELVALARDYKDLQMQLPVETEHDQQREQQNNDLRERVLKLLAEDKGVADIVIPKPRGERLSKEQLEADKKRKLEQISELLDRMAQPPSTSPAKVRNYAMAQKPAGVRMAWKCNYKQALHSSPCGCAKPQMGGKWVILGLNTNQEIKDDK